MPLTTSDSPVTIESCLAVLDEAIGPRHLDPALRVIASSDARSPDEGIALLTAYVSIGDRRVRQAILDTLLAVSSVNSAKDRSSD